MSQKRTDKEFEDNEDSEDNEDNTKYWKKSDQVKKEAMLTLETVIIGVTNIPDQQAKLRQVSSQTMNSLDLLNKKTNIKLIKRFIKLSMEENNVNFDVDPTLVSGLVNVMANIIKAAIEKGPSK